MSTKVKAVNHRCYFPTVGDTVNIKNQSIPKGIKIHRSFGKILSWFGLAIHDKTAGWLNKKSAVRYLQRNQKFIGECKTASLINSIKVRSKAKKVHETFNLAKKYLVEKYIDGQVQHIAIIGGPGTGKTTTINALKTRGEIIKKEVATKLINKALDAKEPNPVYEESFDLKVSSGKADQLKRFETKQKEKQARRVFHDRGPADPLVYATVHKFEISAPLNAQVEENCERFCKLAFFLERIPEYITTKVRPESEQEAKELGEKTEEIYSSRGYTVIRVPSDTIENRVDFILSKTKQFMDGAVITS